jgi:CubicO group peptidase (beta-lactamase class C family)
MMEGQVLPFGQNYERKKPMWTESLIRKGFCLATTLGVAAVLFVGSWLGVTTEPAQSNGTKRAKVAEVGVANGVSWGLMACKVNQQFLFTFKEVADDPNVCAKLKHLTTANDYFPPPESKGGWRKLEKPEDIRKLAGMDPDKLSALKEWLLKSDKRDFAAVVIRQGYMVLEVKRGNSARTDSRRVASVSKAICATVLAIASEHSQQGKTPKKMTFDHPAFDFISWAKPLSDPRKAKITVKQLLNHTSGLAPESSGAKNKGPWEYVLGHSGDPKTAKLAFDPGSDLGYSTHGFYHAALVCEDVTGMAYDKYAIKMLFEPLGVERWWFEYFDGGEKIGRHPSHHLGLPTRELARIAYAMLRGGRWHDRPVIPNWFVAETAAGTHSITGRRDFGRDAESFSHGWELPGLLTDGRGKGIPKGARFKPGSGGQLIAFVPELDLVTVRQTGSSGSWEYEQFVRQACEAVLP